MRKKAAFTQPADRGASQFPLWNHKCLGRDSRCGLRNVGLTKRWKRALCFCARLFQLDDGGGSPRSSRFTFSTGLHMNINKSNKMLVFLLHLQDLLQVLPPLGSQGGQVTFLLGQWELSGWQLGFHHLQLLFHLLHGDEQVLHLTHDRFNYGPRFLFSFSSRFFIYALALHEHSAAPPPFKRYAVIFLFLHELLHWKTSNESFFFPVFSFLSLCCFSFSSLTCILSLNLSGCISVCHFNVREVHGSRSPSFSRRDDNLAFPPHWSKHPTSLPTQIQQHRDTHTHTSFSCLLPLLSIYTLPISRECWSRKRGDRERQGEKKKKGRRKKPEPDVTDKCCKRWQRRNSKR